MEKIRYSVPKMYADHHVLRVREALTSMEGVEDVLASSARRVVVVWYDPAATKAEAIEEQLRASGYGPGEEESLPVLPKPADDESPWFQILPRVTQTNMKDLEASGDFRGY